MSGIEAVAIWAAAMFGYIFSCIVAHKVLKDVLKFETEDMELTALFWPILLGFIVFIYWPFMAMVWTVNMVPRLLNRKTTTKIIK